MKATPISKRIRELEKELSKVDGNIRDLSRVASGVRPPPPVKRRLPPLVDNEVAERVPEAPPVRESEPPARAPRDARFGDYLSAHIERPAGPLRRERSAQRTKAIVTLCLVGLVLFWILKKFFL